MTAKRKPVKATIAHSASRTALLPAEARGRSYPRLAELLREPAFSSLLRGAVVGGAALTAVALSGCEPVECQPTRLGEITTHTGSALSSLLALSLRDAGRELGVGVGIVSHPMALAGAMVAVVPAPLPIAPVPPTEPEPSADADDEEPADDMVDDVAPLAPGGPSLPLPHS